MSKRNKPYVICSLCGVQMFVRERAGIETFDKLVDQGLKEDVLSRVGRLEHRYRKKCPECGKQFWVTPELEQKNWLDGKSSGYHCPEKGCNGVVPFEQQ